MASELRALAAVSAIAAAAMAYARFATSRLSPGLPRLAALFPVLALLPFLPFAFSSIHLRTISAFSLVWLSAFKLLLLSAGAHDGPLHPSLPLPRFVASAALPIKLVDDDDNNNKKNPSTSRCFRPDFALSYVGVRRVGGDARGGVLRRVMATAMTLAFVTGTGSWLFFAPVTRSGLDRAIVAECEGVVAFLEEAGWKARLVPS
uniref:Wax synthase domain-containing protein n=1 Tax=Leersia perrieri TaxID=77586 RepID=A0A0D9WZW6_9ORYZ